MRPADQIRGTVWLDREPEVGRLDLDEELPSEHDVADHLPESRRLTVFSIAEPMTGSPTSSVKASATCQPRVPAPTRSTDASAGSQAERNPFEDDLLDRAIGPRIEVPAASAP